MATFTWTATGAGSTGGWETTANWANSGAAHPSIASFRISPGNDYVIPSANNYTISDIGKGGKAAPDIANSITVGHSFAQAFLLFFDGDAELDIENTLSLNSTLNLNVTAQSANSVLRMGSADSGGTIILGKNARIVGGLGDGITHFGTSTATQITGGGTIRAQDGLFQFGTLVQIAKEATTRFELPSVGTFAFADAVNGGTIAFTPASGGGELDIGSVSTFKAPISGMSVGKGANTVTSFIDFLNVGTAATATLTNMNSSDSTLNIGGQSITLKGNYLGDHINFLSDGANGLKVFLTDTPCYGAGTAILTPDGEQAVDTIQPGDSVMTVVDGGLEPRTVIWTGQREIDLTRHPSPGSVAPIRFRAGALGHGLPRRDLILSPDHCLFIDNALVPARLLINDMTIVRDDSARMVSYHHIELERHGVLLAEGVTAESYLDTGNRAGFSNAGLATVPHPEFSINSHLRCWETDACAPLLTRPEAVKPLWQRFAARAAALGWVPPIHATTTDPAMRLLVDGRMMRPLWVNDQTVRFVVPEGAGSVRLLSRAISPATLTPWLDDPRRLGVPVRSMVLRDRTGDTVLDADHPALTEGWHPAEYAEDGATWRWSGGDAMLPIQSDGPCLLEITLSGPTTYIDQPDRLAA